MTESLSLDTNNHRTALAERMPSLLDKTMLTTAAAEWSIEVIPAPLEDGLRPQDKRFPVVIMLVPEDTILPMNTSMANSRGMLRLVRVFGNNPGLGC